MERLEAELASLKREVAKLDASKASHVDVASNMQKLSAGSVTLDDLSSVFNALERQRRSVDAALDRIAKDEKRRKDFKKRVLEEAICECRDVVTRLAIESLPGTPEDALKKTLAAMRVASQDSIKSMRFEKASISQLCERMDDIEQAVANLSARESETCSELRMLREELSRVATVLERR